MARDLAFLKSKPTAYVVNGETINFYPLSLNALHLLKGLAKPISGALATLFAKTDTDTGRQFDEFADSAASMASSKTKIEPVTVELARFRSTQREQALSQLIECVTDPVIHTQLVQIIADSMRDEFPTKLTGSPLEDLKSKMDLANLLELFKGVVAANGGVFGPLVEKVTAALKETTSPLSPPLPFPASQEEGVESASASKQPTLVRSSNEN